MIKSMTGYGKANLDLELRRYQIEMKSVNHRYLDVSVKMPRVLSYLEEEIKKEVAAKIKRGKVDVFVTFENNSAEGKTIKINKEIAKVYIAELRQLAKEEQISDTIEVTEISKYPDVLSIQNTQDEEVLKREVLQVVKEATNNLVMMREAEGLSMTEDLKSRLMVIEEKAKEISSLSTRLIDDYVVKLEGRIKELIKNQEIEIDDTRLAGEVVIYADKCSVQEEITRLDSHIEQFRNFIQVEGTIGRKLDFLIQEMNRETNTIGSKANHLDITNRVIDIKTELENIREQIQNVE